MRSDWPDFFIWADVPPLVILQPRRGGSYGGCDRCAAATGPGGGTGTLGVRTGRVARLAEGERSGVQWSLSGAEQGRSTGVSLGIDDFPILSSYLPAFEITMVRDHRSTLDSWGAYPCRELLVIKPAWNGLSVNCD